MVTLDNRGEENISWKNLKASKAKVLQKNFLENPLTLLDW